MAARKGRAALRQDVAEDRRASQICRLERLVGGGATMVLVLSLTNQTGAFDDIYFQGRSARGCSPGPCSRVIKSSSHSCSFPSAGTRVDCKGLVQLHACG